MFTPEVGLELVIEGKPYRVAAHPAAPWMVYGQEGRAAIVYRLEDESGPPLALKVFKPRYRQPLLVEQARLLAPFARLPGLRVCARTVLSPNRNGDLLQRYPDLSYAVLMPWIEGPTWMEVVLEKRPLEPEVALKLASRLAGVLAGMEAEGIAHGDLSAPNVMLPALAEGEGVELVDVEGLYAPGMQRPEVILSGSMGYAHQEARAGYWDAEADRFAGAVLIAEMLGWCDERVREAAWGESYFAPEEVQQESERYRLLLEVLETRWGDEAREVFQAAWASHRLEDCPRLETWQEVCADLQGGEETASFVKPAATPESMESAALGLYQLMQAALQQGDWQEAQRLGQALETLRPGYRDVRKLLRRAQRATDEERKAQAEIERWAQRIGAAQARLEAELRRLQEQQEPLKAASRLLEEARALLAQHQWEESQRRLQTIQLLGLPLSPQADGEDTDASRQRRDDAAATSPPERRTVSPPPPAAGASARHKPVVKKKRRLAHRKGAWGKSPVISVAFSPDGALLASGGKDGLVRLWSVGNGSSLLNLKGHTGKVLRVLFSPDGAVLASGSQDRTVRFWRVRDGKLLHIITSTEDTGNVLSIAFSPDGEVLACGSDDDRIYLWRVRDGKPLGALKGHTAEVYSVAFSPDGEVLASGGKDHTVRLWQMRDGKHLHTLEGHTKGVYALSFSADGELLASGSADGTLLLWRMPEGKLMRALAGHTAGVESVAFSQDGKLLASGGWDRTVRIWQVSHGDLLHTLKEHSDVVRSVTFSPDSRWLASASDDGTVVLWQMRPQ